MPQRGELKGLGARPLVMGILNVTPDSFSDGGKYFDPRKALEHAETMTSAGADIIDIGGESTRPGSESVSLQEELDRVMPVIEMLCAEEEIAVSIDTVKPEVARAALEAGASMINDISALQLDNSLAALAAEYGAYLVLMHMRGTPKDMQNETHYDDIIGEISGFLNDAASKAENSGVEKEKIIIDPGIGFGKSVEGNFVLLKSLHEFAKLGYPILVGASRKSFLGKALGLDISQRMEASLAAACYAVMNGADIVRVHDVAETKRALTVIEKITGAERA
jgi:dihydropteroate synthase